MDHHGTGFFSQDPVRGNQPTQPTGSDKLPPLSAPNQIGAGVAFAAPLPIELDFPGNPKRYFEAGPVRFKFILDGKYEVFKVSTKGEHINGSNEVKIDFAKQSASVKTGLKGKLTPNIDAQALAKISPDSISALGMAMKDPKKFGIALLRYLDVVIGHNFPVDSKYLSFAGVGWAFDTDFCFFSVLLPLRYPLKWEPQGTNLSMGGNIVCDLIVKVGPSREAWRELCAKFGKPQIYSWMRLMMAKANMTLPKVVTRASAVAEEMASGSAFLEALGVWAGAFSLALPISLALRDFSLYLCRCARESGIKDGQMMVFADAYVKTIYGLDSAYNPQDGVMRVKNEGRKKAVEDMDRYGRVHLQLYLEKHFNNSQRCADQEGNAFNRMKITAMGEGLWLQLRRKFL